MATTLTTMNDTMIVSQIIGALKYGLIPVQSTSFEVDTAGRVQNDVMRVPVITDATAQSKTPGTALTSNGTVTGTSITLTHFYEAKWQLNEAQINPTRAPGVFAALAAGAGYGIAKLVVDSIVADITAAHFGNADSDKLVVAPADFGMNDLGQLIKKAGEKQLGRDRALVLNAAYAGALIGESSLGLILATSGDAAIRTGVLPPLMGMNVYVYAGLTSPTGENLGGWVCDKTAIACAMAAPELLAAPGEGNLMAAEIIADPESQVTALYKRWYDADAGTIYGSIALLYDTDKINDSVIRIVSA